MGARRENGGREMKRALNIALRTVHIGAMGLLLGGCAFEVVRTRLTVVVWLTVGTGVALGVTEAVPRLSWFHEGRGLVTMAKVALVCAVPLAPAQCLPILLVVVVMASVGAHMPGRFRHYSVLYRRVLRDARPGGAESGGTVADDPA